MTPDGSMGDRRGTGVTRQPAGMIPGFFGVGERVMSVLLLNAVWLLACLPVVTIAPATAALFEVTRRRVEHGEQRVIGPFLEALRGQFSRAFVVGLLVTGAGLVLVLDLAYVVQADKTSTTYVVYVVTLLAGLSYAIATAFLFPVLVASPDTGWRNVLCSSALLGLSRPGVALLCTLLLAAAVTVCWFVPYAIVVAGSTVAHGTYRICRKSLYEALERDARAR